MYKRQAVGVVVYDGKTTTAKLVDDSKQMYNIGGCPSMDEYVATFADIVNEAYAGKFATTLYTLDGSKMCIRDRCIQNASIRSCSWICQ